MPDSAYWRAQATQARKIAKEMSRSDHRAAMEQIAGDYDRLCVQAEERERREARDKKGLNKA